MSSEEYCTLLSPKPKSQRRLYGIGALVTVAVVLAVVLGITLSHGEKKKNNSSPVVMDESLSVEGDDNPTTNPSMSPVSNGDIILDTTTNGMVYYRCHGPGTLQIVLLHGASFSKETWKDNGILQDFCSKVKAVFAFDWPANEFHGYEDLMSTFEALEQAQLLDLPDVVLVTPSASGYSMVDWITHGNVTLLPDYMMTWVPVAPAALSSATDEQLASLIGKVNILAIYGDEDISGGEDSQRLGDLAGSTVVELTGGHAVYLASPEEFVTTIVERAADLPSAPSTNTNVVGTTPEPSSAPAMTDENVVATTPAPTSAPAAMGEIFEETSSNGIVYYRCEGPGTLQIILLHGSSFSKETYKNNGILQDFCSKVKVVFALDWPWYPYDHLIDTLEAFEQGGLIDLPNKVVVVTPSASGYTMVSWMTQGNVTLIPNYLSTWVPVAPVSLPSATDDQVASLRGIVNILAINGDEDTAGGKYSQRLADLAGATKVELPGHHAVYLQSPVDFVTTIVEKAI